MRTRTAVVAASLLSAGFVALCAVPTRAAGRLTAGVPVWVRGEQLEESALRDASGTRLLMPMRAIFSALGAQVEWDARERAVYAWKPDGAGVRLAVGEGSAQTMKMAANPSTGAWGEVTGESRLDSPATMVKARVYVPLRFVAETFGEPVSYMAVGPKVTVGTDTPSIEDADAVVYCGSFELFTLRGRNAGKRAGAAMDTLNDHLGGKVGKVTLRTSGPNISILLNNQLFVEVTPADAAGENVRTVKTLATTWSQKLDAAFRETKTQVD